MIRSLIPRLFLLYRDKKKKVETGNCYSFEYLKALIYFICLSYDFNYLKKQKKDIDIILLFIPKGSRAGSVKSVLIPADQNLYKR